MLQFATNCILLLLLDRQDSAHTHHMQSRQHARPSTMLSTTSALPCCRAKSHIAHQMPYSSLYPSTHASTEGLSRNTFFRMLSSGVSFKACVPTTHLITLLGRMFSAYSSSGFCSHCELISRASLMKDSMSRNPKLCLACCWLAAFETCVNSASISMYCWQQCGWVSKARSC